MSWTQRLFNVFRSARLHRDLEKELGFHIQEREDELRAGGMNAAEAHRAARLRFGGFHSQLERTREADINLLLESLFRNLRQAARSLAKAPAFSFSALATLALGIGASTGVFSAIDAILLRPLPYPAGEQLVKLDQVSPQAPIGIIAPARLADWNRLNDTFQAISGYYVEDASEVSGEMPERLRRAFVAPEFFRVLGVAPTIGRDFNPAEWKFKGPPAVIVSDRIWRRRLDAAADLTGKRLRVGTAYLPVVGVMPPTFAFPDREVDLWSPGPPDAPHAQGRDLTWFEGIGRLRRGVTPPQARANLLTVQAGLGRQYGGLDAKLGASVVPLKDVRVGHSGRTLWILFGSVTLLLVLTCANVAALLLSRAAGRRSEMAVRFSLGASRVAVAGHLLGEALVLALGGALLGLLVAGWTIGAFRSLAANLPRVEEIAFDWRMLAFALFCATAATLLCGLLPAWFASRDSLNAVANRQSRSTAAGRSRFQLALTGVQVALAVALLAGAGLLSRSLHELARISPGFDSDNVITFRVSASWSESANPPDVANRLDRILSGLRELPGVAAAASTVTLPGMPEGYQIEFQSVEGGAAIDRPLRAESRFVTPSYFETMRIPLLEGELCPQNAGKPTMMVNRAFARAYFDGQPVIGRNLKDAGNPFVRPAEVRGIVGDAREKGLHQTPPPAVYWCGYPLRPGAYLAVRTHGASANLTVDAVRRKIQEVAPGRSVYDFAALRENIDDSYSQDRLRTFLVAFFALAAVSLSCIGLYGTLSYQVQLRRREIGVRLALGALRGLIARQLLTGALIVTAIGCAGGLLLALAGKRLLQGLLFGVSASDPFTLAGAAAAMLFVAAAASLLPALRAARLDPAATLREE